MADTLLPADLRSAGPWAVSQTRYLYREWIRWSPGVRKHQSVPVLRLVPSNRPLFFCDNCCSANFYVPICLWCKWTSLSAKKSFEKKTPRGRTMSAPGLSSVLPDRGKRMVGPRDVTSLRRKTDPRGSLETEKSTEPPKTPRSVDQAPDSVTGEWVNISMNDARLHASNLRSLSGSPRGRRVQNGKQRLFNVDVDSSSITPFNRFAHGSLSDNGHAYESKSSFSDNVPQRFRRSTDSRCTGTKSEGHVSRFACNPDRTRNTTNQSPFLPPSFHRRPLYHYIRNKTPTARSTFDCGAVPETAPIPPHRSAHHHDARQLSEIPSAYISELDYPRVVALCSGKGFSLSGETEQRMKLARTVPDGRFIFHERGPTSKRDRIMRGLRRSFKGFFSSKASG